ncbi:DUF6152 family protein [Falsiroseomonas oryziterrae]|uniref:DUF6152 family protein n=1 Tax=Falsiroseomonas oryziterrae TaxID=2911368 RepID=UPI001F1FCA8F|nr:DUF6152 family protein [Roseomonas sp. NPKOSM-4]
MPSRRSLIRLAPLALAPAALARPAAAHHGWGTFDREQTADVTAPVVRSTFANPHGVVVIRRDNRDLTFELAPVGRMQARGLNEADIAPGRSVRLFGYRNVQNPSLYRAEWIEVAGRRIELR